MRQIEPPPEPPEFDSEVRQRGHHHPDFPPSPPVPATFWKGREYWRRSLDWLHRAHAGVCAYTGHFLSHGRGTVDHFLAKSTRPDLAYEWSNYRLCSLETNARKAEHGDVLDPHAVRPGWFRLDLRTGSVRPGDGLDPTLRGRVHATIKRLKLSTDRNLIRTRLKWYRYFREGRVSLEVLDQEFPFLAWEIRQTLHQRTRPETGSGPQ